MRPSSPLRASAQVRSRWTSRSSAPVRRLAFAVAVAIASPVVAQTGPEPGPRPASEPVDPIQTMPGSPSTPRGIGERTLGAEVLPGEEHALPFVPAPIHPDRLYAGWRVLDLVDEPLLGVEGRPIGTVKDLVIGLDGRVEAIVVESGGILDLGDTHIRVPWSDVDLSPGEPGIAVPLTEEEAEIYDPYDDRGWVRTTAREFRATEVIGDYVSLVAGPGFGIVIDLVVSPEGALLAALVDRRGALGGGILAYPFVERAADIAAAGDAGAAAGARNVFQVDPDRFADPF